MSMLQNALIMIRTEITNKTCVHFSQDEYQAMRDTLSVYVEYWKKDPLWNVACQVQDYLSELCRKNGNIFIGEDCDDKLEETQEQSFNELIKLLKTI